MIDRSPEDYARQDSLEFDLKPAYKAHNRPPKAVCPHCGASMQVYAHSLTRGLCDALVRLYRYGSPARLRDLALSPAMFTNFQKLRYFGLVEQVEIDETRTGKWRLTDLGEQFVRRTVRVPSRVHTYRGKVQRQDGEMVLITDVLPGYFWKIDYARDAQSVSLG